MAETGTEQWPSQLFAIHRTLLADEGVRRQACREFHTIIVDSGLRDVEAKADFADADEAKWESKQRKHDKSDLPVSLVGITGVTHFPDHALGECIEPLHTWLVRLSTAGDCIPLWLSSYQLLIHFQAFTGGFGFQYKRSGRQWVHIQDPNHQFGFLQLASWLVTAIRAYASATDQQFTAVPQLPWGSCFRVWQRCIHINASPTEFTRIDNALRKRGIGSIKSVRSAFGQIGHFSSLD